MTRYDEAKTKELLVNIGEEGIEIKDISKLLCKKIIGIKLHGSRGKMSTSVELKSLGLSNYSKVCGFIDSNMNNGVINFFDKEVVKSFDSLLNKIRQSIYRYSISNDGQIYYMTEGNYFEFKKKFDEKYLKDFEDFKKSLIKELPKYRKTFKDNLSVFASTRGLSDKEEKLLFQRIFYRFPTEEEIKRNCNLSYSVIAFPVFNEDNVEGVNDEIKKVLIEDKDASAIETFYEMIGSSLEKAYSITSKCIDFISVTTENANRELDFKMPSKTKAYMNDLIATITEDNKVLKNTKLKNINYLISRTFREKVDNEGEVITNNKALEMAELILGNIYCYAKYLEIDEMLSEAVIKSGYDPYDLETIGDVMPIETVL